MRVAAVNNVAMRAEFLGCTGESPEGGNGEMRPNTQRPKNR